MPYLVRLADRALRDMEAIYEFIDAEASETAFAWFNDLAREIYSLERFPERGTVIRESKKLRHLLFGKKPSTYRIIYALDKRKRLVSVLHIRHSARAPLSAKEKGSCSSPRIHRLLCPRDSLLPYTRISRFSVPR
jgi:toxin ParE1/3/4